jgi:aldose 1-epimerase
MDVQKTRFGKTPDGKQVDLYTLTNAGGCKVTIMNYGATVVRIEVPDRNGNIADVTLGYDTLGGYFSKNNPYFGAIVGRYGNRIAKGRFTLDGVEYQLATNDGENHLHGGVKGFDKVVWDAEGVQSSDGPGVKLSYLSRDGEEGYPGNLSCTVEYTLTKENELRLEYAAETNKATVLNLTNHTYFNLRGQGTGDILSHQLTLNAVGYMEVDDGLIPTGSGWRRVKGTPMDFTVPATIGSRIAEVGGGPNPVGYDHNYVLADWDRSLKLAATVYDATSGRVMEVFTTQPGMQLYSGNFLDGSVTGKNSMVYQQYSGLCLETQHFPDSPNRSRWPSVVLRPGEKYWNVTVYKFSAK